MSGLLGDDGLLWAASPHNYIHQYFRVREIRLWLEMETSGAKGATGISFLITARHRSVLYAADATDHAIHRRPAASWREASLRFPDGSQPLSALGFRPESV